MDYDNGSRRMSPLFKDMSGTQSDQEGARLRLVNSIMKRIQHIEKEFNMHKAAHKNVKGLLSSTLEVL